MFARDASAVAAPDAARRLRTLWLWGVAAAAAVAAWVLVAGIRIPPAYQALPMHEVAPAAFLRMALVAVVAFCGLWWSVLLSQSRREILRALAVIMTASLAAGSLALLREAAPRVEQQSALSLTISKLGSDNQDIINRYTDGMRAIGPEAKLSPFNLGRGGDLAQSRKAVAEATRLIDRSRQAYTRTLIDGKAALSQARARPDVKREALVELEARHAELETFWSLQGQYGALLREQLAVIERRGWRVRQASFVFDKAADRRVHEDLLGRMAVLSRAIDNDIAGRSATILP